MTASAPSFWAHKLVSPQNRTSMEAKENFHRQFRARVSTFQDQLRYLSTLSAASDECRGAEEAIRAGIARLERDVADAADDVPAYDRRTYASAVRALTNTLNETVARVAPKPKFRFKARTATRELDDEDARRHVGGPAAGVPLQDNQNQAAFVDDTPPPERSEKMAPPAKTYNALMAPAARYPRPTVAQPSYLARDIAFNSHSSLHIALPVSAGSHHPDLLNPSASLTDLLNCFVDLSAVSKPFAGLYVDGVTRCLVLAGRIEGSMYVTNLCDSLVVVAARQIRLHECRRTTFYLWCGSRPIIEDCKDIQFAPLPACFARQSDAAENRWDQVDDFKWLKVEHSPNWCILPDEKRLPNHVWEKIQSSEEETGVDEILAMVGVTS